MINHLTISEIKRQLEAAKLSEVEAFIPLLEADHRSGVKQLAIQYKRKVAEENRRLLQWETLNLKERKLRSQGYFHIAGVDEVGRGPLAGPLVVAAVVLPPDFECIGINDSKQIKKELREEYAAFIKEKAVGYSLTFIEAREIDRINIHQATLLGMKQAVESCSIQPDFCLIDAMKPPISIPYQTLVKGDARSVSIAAASIIAKVARDEWMTNIANLFPQYGFENHVGYATLEHQEALRKYGPTPIHRQTFIKHFIQ